jgi:hypothetical protein
VPRLVEIGHRLLDGPNARDLREPRDRLGLDVDDDPARDVVRHDRSVGRGCDRLEVRHDPALWRLVVVRGDGQECIRAELVRPLGELDRVRGRSGAGVRDDARPVADSLDRRSHEVEPLPVVERRALPGRAGDDEPVRAVVDEVARQRLEAVVVDCAGLVERRDDRSQDTAEHARIVSSRVRA